MSIDKAGHDHLPVKIDEFGRRKLAARIFVGQLLDFSFGNNEIAWIVDLQPIRSYRILHVPLKMRLTSEVVITGAVFAREQTDQYDPDHEATDVSPPGDAARIGIGRRR